MYNLNVQTFSGGPLNTNAYLVKVDDLYFLFDAPEGVFKWIKSKNITLDGLFLTHQHYDHVIDAGKIQKYFNCNLCAHSNYSRDLTLLDLVETISKKPFIMDTYNVNFLLHNKTSFNYKNINWEVYNVPGHSPDSICFRLNKGNFLISGDTLFCGGIGRTDFPNGDGNLLLSSIKEKIFSLDDSIEILPGHGIKTTIGKEKINFSFL